MTDIRRSAADLAADLASGATTSVELTQASLDRIAEVDGALHAFLHVDADGALAAAKASDERRASGQSASALDGVPIAVKDVLATRGLPTTCGSRILEGWVPPYDATAVARVKAAGLPILGKTNMDEFAMGSSTEHSAYGTTHNPWDLARIPGGSGGGSAAAVASFEAPIALGTDTGGSIRQPGAVTGTVGVKPTYGGVSRYGLVSLANSLDQVGPVTRTVLDSALLHEVIGGHDPKDSTSIDQPLPSLVEAARQGATGDLSGLRVGVVKELGGEGYQTGVLTRFQESLDLLVKAGADELIRLTAAELADKVRTREVSAVEVARAHLDRIAEVDGTGLGQGTLVSALDGVPIAVKDVLATQGLPTTCGSKILELSLIHI